MEYHLVKFRVIPENFCQDLNVESISAAFTTLRSILIRDYIGLSALASAFGFTLAFQGMAAIASSPMAG